MTETRITFRVTRDDHLCDLKLTDVRDLADLAGDVDVIMNACHSQQGMRVSLLPPLPADLSARAAFKVIVDVWLAIEPARRPVLECLVHSDAVIDALIPLLPCDDKDTSFQIGSLRLSVVEGNIATIVADAIVNASNTTLRLGGGVSAAIRQACGAGLAAEMASIARRRPLGDGDGVVTSSHGLRTARFIIHTASASGDDETVARSLRTVLALSVQHRFESVALPALGTGTGGMAIARFAGLLVEALREHAAASAGGGAAASYPQVLRLILFHRSDKVAVTKVLMAELAPAASE